MYFDIYNNEKQVILASLTINKKNIIEEKLYMPFTKEFYYNSLILLRKNKSLVEYKNYRPFDILYRKINKKLKSIKYYYENIYQNKILFSDIYKKYFNILRVDIKKNNHLNLKDEI